MFLIPRFDFSAVTDHWQFLLQGLVVTLEVCALGMLLATALGLAVAVLRIYGGKTVDRGLGFVVDVMRSIPLLALMVWVFYALPVLVNGEMSPFLAGVISLGVQYAAFMSEVFRAGLGSISPGQRLAALALGMTPFQALYRVIVPQAAVRMLPPMGSQLVSLIKDSSLLYGIAVAELMHQAATLNGLYARPFEIFTAIAIVYVVLTYPVTLGVNAVYRRLVPLTAG